MELQFNKTVIPCLRTVSRQMQMQEQTQEVRLTDGMPDIGKVLASWGQILVRGKEWHTGGAGVSGGIMVWVLYAPEDGTELQCIETWLPFQIKWDIPDTGRDGTISVMPMLRSVDARSLSARKLMVRAGIGMLGEAMVPADAEIYSPGELPEDVQVLKNAYPMCLARESGEKAFTLEETLSLPSTVPAIGKLIRYTLRPEVVDQKVMADKVVMRGVASLGILYKGADGQLHSWEFELPFSQYAELEREYGSDAEARIQLAVTSLELEQGEEENLNLKAGLTGQYVIYDRPMVEIVEDAYSPNRSVTPQMSKLETSAVLDTRTETVHAEHMAQMDSVRAVDVVFYPDYPQLHRQADEVSSELSGVFQVLAMDAEGKMQSLSSRWEENRTMQADQDTRVDMTVQPSGNTQAAMNGGNVNLRADMLVDTVTTASQGLPMVTGLELGEVSEPDPNRPSLILRRAGTDRLWDMAKRTGSTVEAIQKANDLHEEPDSDRILLIPVS